MATREELLACKPQAPVALDVPEWGRVYIKRLDAIEAEEWQKFATAALNKDGVVEYPATFRAKLCQLTVCDEAGKLTFKPEDVGLLTKQPTTVLAEVFAAAARLNKLGDDQLEAARSFFDRIQPNSAGTK